MSTMTGTTASGEGEERLSRAEQQQRTRDRLLAAAAEVFAVSGFGGASLDTIAARAGYTRGAVYSNFADKSELLLALFDRGAATFRSEQLPRLIALPEGERATALARWFLEEDEPGQLLLLLELARLRETESDAAEALDRVLATIRDTLDGAMGSDPALGDRSEPERRALAEGVLVVLHGVRALRLIHGAPDPQVVARLIDAVLSTEADA